MEIIDIIKESVNTTLKKYPTNEESFIKTALKQIFSNNKFDYFTKDNNARKNMEILGTDILTIELIRGALLSKQIEEQQGKIREICIEKNKFPETVQQAKNYVFEKIKQEESPSIVYTEITRTNPLRELLIDNYANLVATTTQEERQIAKQNLTSLLGNKLATLDNMETSMLIENQNTMIDPDEDNNAIGEKNR